MKIAVYTICKNEAGFLTRWLESCKDADVVHVTDTGSTDETLIMLQETALKFPRLSFNVVDITPWRYDEARNYSLHSLSSDVDVCVCLDMDEVLVPGWRQVIEREWTQDLDRLRYGYVWSWNYDDSPGTTYHADKIHARHGFRWVHPVHEVLRKDKRLTEERQKFVDEVLIHHFPDHSKSRSSYLDLLALAVSEDPLDDRNAHYYARDLMFAGHYEKAIAEFKRHLMLPRAVWKSERAASMRYLGDCYWALGDHASALEWFNQAVREAPYEREPYVALAQAHRAFGQWSLCKENCELALSITDKPMTYINQPSAWSDWPETMLKEAEEKLNGKN